MRSDCSLILIRLPYLTICAAAVRTATLEAELQRAHQQNALLQLQLQREKQQMQMTAYALGQISPALMNATQSSSAAPAVPRLQQRAFSVSAVATGSGAIAPLNARSPTRAVGSTTDLQQQPVSATSLQLPALRGRSLSANSTPLDKRRHSVALPLGREKLYLTDSTGGMLPPWLQMHPGTARDQEQSRHGSLSPRGHVAAATSSALSPAAAGSLSLQISQTIPTPSPSNSPPSQSASPGQTTSVLPQSLMSNVGTTISFVPMSSCTSSCSTLAAAAVPASAAITSAGAESSAANVTGTVNH